MSAVRCQLRVVRETRNTRTPCAHARHGKHGGVGSAWCRRVCFAGSKAELCQALPTTPLAVIPAIFLVYFQTFTPIDVPTGSPIPSRLVPPRDRVRWSSLSGRLVPPRDRVRCSPFVPSTKWLSTFPSGTQPAANKREPFPMPSLCLRPAKRTHPVPYGALAPNVPVDIS